MKKIIILTGIIVFTALAAHANIGQPGEEVDVPIDGGLSLLLAAGVGYGAKKLKERRRKF